MPEPAPVMIVVLPVSRGPTVETANSGFLSSAPMAPPYHEIGRIPVLLERLLGASGAGDAGAAHRADVGEVVGDDPENPGRLRGVVDEAVRALGVEGDVVAVAQRLRAALELDLDLAGD